MNYELKQNCVFARFLGQVACSRFVLVSVFSLLDWKENEFSISTLVQCVAKVLQVIENCTHIAIGCLT
jgi:hypothetical protein